MDSPLDRFDVGRLRDGDAMAWTEFVHAAAPRLRAIIRRTLEPAGRHADVPDVLQEVFGRLCRDDFKLVRNFDPRKGRLASWLAVLTARAAIDHLRKHGAALASLDDSTEVTAHSAALAGESTLPLPPDLLSPQQELILRLCYEDDRDVSEIAEILRTQPQTVRSQRHKALERLRAFLARRAFF